MAIVQQKFQQNLIATTDENRKRRTITIIALVVLFMSSLSLLSVPYYDNPKETLIYTVLNYKEPYQVALSSFGSVFASVLAILLTRILKNTWMPGVIISAGIFTSILFSDNFSEIANGRSTIFLLIPILVSAITISPFSAFVFAALTSIVLILIPLPNTNVYAISAMWVVAFTIWLAISTMESAIHKAQQETSRIRAMLGIVSHELRTPLSSINGYTDLLLVDKQMDKLQIKMLSNVKDSTIHLTDLVNRLLDTAHIQSGKIILKPTSVSTNSLFDALVDRAVKQANNKRLKFVYQKGDLPAAIIVDLVRLQQIVSNLVDNAVKFTEKGIVTLRVERVKNSIAIAVSDTGPGIPKKDIPLLFEEFIQTQHYTIREYGGVGLGLSIVYHLVKLMQGVIVVDSKVGTGTTMTVTLPLT